MDAISLTTVEQSLRSRQESGPGFTALAFKCSTGVTRLRGLAGASFVDSADRRELVCK